MTDNLNKSEAFENFTNLQKAISTASNGLYVVAHLLYEAKYNGYYKELGYSSLAEYAAQDEIGLSKNVTSKLIAIYENFCVLHKIHITQEANIFKDYTKAYMSIPLLKKTNAEEVADIVNHNSTADIITRVKELEGKSSMVFPEQITPIRRAFNSSQLAARWLDRVHSKWFKSLDEDDQLLILDTLSYFERNMI
jgi:nitrate reductase alpha subunit